MSLELRRRPVPPKLEPSLDTGGPPLDHGARRTDGCNVLVTSGIHRGRFPIAGLRVREARHVLRRLVPIEDGALAVINGRAVEEDAVISENVTHVAFVKPSAIKGAV